MWRKEGSEGGLVRQEVPAKTPAGRGTPAWDTGRLARNALPSLWREENGEKTQLGIQRVTCAGLWQLKSSPCWAGGGGDADMSGHN